ncbi:hypothetical protein BC830DRAFT_1163898 [Chytriomyces sp. MP71]|nr:hypothetical protein BC830DRAFT_1163898 [Chytriomyces sp. MP71]
MGATPSQTRPATAPFQKKGIDQPTTRIAVALDTWPVNGDAFITLILSLATRHFPQGQFNFTFHHWSPNAPFVFRPDMPDRLAQLQLNGARPTAMQLLSIVGNVTAHFHARPVGPAGLPLCGADIFVQAVLSPKTRKTPHIGLNVTLKGPLHLLFAPNAAALGPNAIVPTLSFEQALEVAQMHPSVRSNRVETISTHAWGPGDALGWYKGSLAFYFPFGFHGCVVVDAGTGGYLDYVEPDPIGTGNGE